VKRTFTIAVMLCATLAAGAQAQTNRSGGKTTLVDLEAQAKAKKKAKASNQTTQKSAPKKDDSTPPASGDGQTSGTNGQTGTQNTGSAQPATPDQDEKKIYKSSDIPDTWKFKKEKDKEAAKKAPATSDTTGTGGTSGTNATPSAAPAPAAPAAGPATPQASAPAATPAATGAAPAPAASAPASTTAPATAPASAPAAASTTTTAKKRKPASARTAKPSGSSTQAWQDRGYISASFGWQASSATFSDTRTLPSTDSDTESRRLTADYEVKAGPSFDVGGAARVWKSLGFAASVTRYSASKDIAISGTVPHPFFFDRLRPVSGATPGTREELAVHLDAVWVVPANHLQIAVFGGPTFFSAKQTIVNDFTFAQQYPYDDATFTSGVTAEESKSVAGFNVGADVGYFFTDIFGVGGVVRFSRGTLKSSIGDLDVGGPEIGVGVRIRLRQSTAPKAPRVPPAKPAPKGK
jgi:hypothetical protein